MYLIRALILGIVIYAIHCFGESGLTAQDQPIERVYGSDYRESLRLYQKAVEMIQEQEHSMALELLDKAIYLQPDFVEAYHQRAQLYEDIKQPANALTDYQIVLHLDSTYVEAAFNRAVLRFKEQQFLRAASEFKKVLRMPLGETRMVYFKSTPLNSSEEAGIDAITTTEGIEGDVYNYLGLCYHELSEFDSAEWAFNNAISHNSSEPNYYVNRALNRQQMGRDTLAYRDFNNALKLSPEHPVAQFNITAYKESSGTLELHSYDQLIQDNPGFTSPYVNRALAKMKLGDYQGAIEDYDQALQLDPEDPQILLNRGLAREKLQDLSGALKDLNSALRYQDNFSTAYKSRGRVLFALNEYNLALEDFNQAIALDQEDGAAYFNRSLVNRKLGRNQECCQDLLQAQQLGIKTAIKAFNSYCK